MLYISDFSVHKDSYRRALKEVETEIWEVQTTGCAKLRRPLLLPKRITILFTMRGFQMKSLCLQLGGLMWQKQRRYPQGKWEGNLFEILFYIFEYLLCNISSLFIGKLIVRNFFMGIRIFPDIYRLGSEVDLFENLVPLAIHQALASYSTKKTTLVRKYSLVFENTCSDFKNNLTLGGKRNSKNEGCYKCIECNLIFIKPPSCFGGHFRFDLPFFT